MQTSGTDNVGVNEMPRKGQLMHEVLTPQEVADFLRVSKETVEQEIRGGSLPARQIGSEWRIFRNELERYLKGNAAQPKPVPGSTGKAEALNLSTVKPFKFVWPNKREENFTKAYEGSCVLYGQNKRVTVAFSNAGSTAPSIRGTVFVDGRPMVRFKPADDFESSGLMLSIIKTADRKQLRPQDLVPPEYSRFRVEPYRNHINKRHASKNMAVVCPRSELGIMAAHGLIRAEQIEDRRER